MPVKLQRVVSSDVQAYPDAYLKTREKKKKRAEKRKGACESRPPGLSGDISCTDTGGGTPAALTRRPPNQQPAAAGKSSPSPYEALPPLHSAPLGSEASRLWNKMFL